MDFTSHFTKWKTQLRDAALGPLLVAEEVVKFREEWDPKENDNRTYSCALEDVLGDGKNLRFFGVRAQASAALAPFRAARMFEHSAAVWLFNTSVKKEGVLGEAVKMCAVAYNQNHKCPLTAPQVIRATRDLFGFKIKTRIHHCVGCVTKEAEIGRLTAELEAKETDEKLRRKQNKQD